MGQANSRASAAPSSEDPRIHGRHSRRRASWAPSLLSRPVQAGSSTIDDRSHSHNHGHDRNHDNDSAHLPQLLPAPSSRRLSQRINPFHRHASHPARPHDAGPSTLAATPQPRPSPSASPSPSHTPVRRPQSRLTRARSSLGSLSGLLHSRPSHPQHHDPPSASRQSQSEPRPALPQVPSMPDLDLDLDLDRLLGNAAARDRSASDATTSRPPPTPTSLRRDARPLSMLPRLRNSLGPSRRRRSLWHDDDNNNMDSIERLRRGEDQADVLSRLLSLAAAATAASLVGEDHHAATRDGTFDTFLQSLQNGSIASALRGNQPGDAADAPGATPAPLNFFRMFRFGSSHPASPDSRQRGRDSASAADAHDGDDDSEARMVPIIIVGIRSINPASGTAHDDANIPPFLDALSSFPTPPTSPGDNDTLLRPQNGTRFSHRRRASMGGFNFPSHYDSQRHHRTRPHDQPRPSSPALADSPPGPTLPPLRLPQTLHDPPIPQAPLRRLQQPPRRPRRPTRTHPHTTEEEEPQTTTRSPRQRRLSESDFTRYGSGAPRRRGVVEPDNNPGEGSRSWIIYVLGGSYPENHPILTTPSLFTDSPTYEDMMLLSSILGPAKAPVASEGDVAAAPGLFRIVRNLSGLVAEEVEGDESMELARDARCLVCLCDFEANEEARKLVKCEHLFHKICIDQWLTTGRNSCPLCRGQGVDETPAPDLPDAPPPPSSMPAPAEAVA
ncbi:hypothetical protein EKO04_007837 [Ascochyta lentis]|uniref:RING-type domain-containing protein n=1 Tax=Ascochyta lentis TaxID=205686 RepID=A0A8H7IZB2_9PLEO|nr:hypothetical protein EKO04_007837 [Ascochyta lentis]